MSYTITNHFYAEYIDSDWSDVGSDDMIIFIPATQFYYRCLKRRLSLLKQGVTIFRNDLSTENIPAQ